MSTKTKERKQIAFSAAPFKLDFTHMVSKLQLETLKEITMIGEKISFYKVVTRNYKSKSQEVTVKIEGRVAKKYTNLFILEDGRSYTWTDYITGNIRVRDLVENMCPLAYHIDEDRSVNLYSYRLAR